MRLRASVMLCVATIALVGCVAEKPAATTTAADPAGKATCFANQQSVETQVQQALFADGSRRVPMNYGQLKGQGFITELLWCPAGGDLTWVPTEMRLICSVHGHYTDNDGVLD